MQLQNYINLEDFSNWLRTKAKIFCSIDSSWTKKEKIRRFNGNNFGFKKEQKVLVIEKLEKLDKNVNYVISVLEILYIWLALRIKNVSWIILLTALFLRWRYICRSFCFLRTIIFWFWKMDLIVRFKFLYLHFSYF